MFLTPDDHGITGTIPRPPLRVAMVGGGVNSAIGRTHVTALRMDGEFELVAGCFSRDRAVNHRSAAAYGLDATRAVDDLDQLLDRHGDVDAVVVATPIAAHAEQLHAVLDAGMTAITDKPLVSSAAEGRLLAARASSTELFVTYNYTGYPAVRDLRARVRRGDLGELTRIVLEMPQDTYQRLVNAGQADRVQDWRRRDGSSACVSLDLFVHLHSLAVHVTGQRLVEVAARSRSVAGLEPGLVDDVDALLTFDGGLRGHAWYGKAALGAPNGLGLRLYGTRGSAAWDQQQPGVLQLADHLGRRSTQDCATPGSTVADDDRYMRFKAGHPAGFVEAFANHYLDIATSIRTGRLSGHLLDLGVGVEGLAACEAIAHSSARDGAPTRVGALDAVPA